MPDQTYLQQAQPSTFGHYALSFAYPTLRDARRLLDCLDWVNSSPGGAGCVNGSRLLGDRNPVAELLGFSRVIEHTRDAMWQVDGLISILSTAASLLSNQSKLAEDLEIWSSSEFDFVDLAGPYTRSSILMPQKRNPYALSIVRGASGILIGRLAGFLAVVKSPSARSDNLIFAYGEVPRALDLAIRVTRLMTGVVSTLRVNKERMAAELTKGFSQATDLAEFVVQRCRLDYRAAYVVVGETVRTASRQGLRGIDITGEMLDQAALEHRGHTLGLTGADLTCGARPETDRHDPHQRRRGRPGRGGSHDRLLPGPGRRPADHGGTMAIVGRTGRSETAGRRRGRGGHVGHVGHATRSPAVTTMRLPDQVSVVNIGLPLFADAIRAQGRPVAQVEWRIPAEGDPDAVGALRRTYGVRSAAIDEANAEVVRRLDKGVSKLVAIQPAASVLPGIDDRTVVHSGPPIDWAAVCDPLRRSIRAAVMAEGWAADPDAATRLIESGGVRLEPANHHDTVVPMASAIGPSAPMYVVDNEAGATRAYSPINQGPGQVPVVRHGNARRGRDGWCSSGRWRGRCWPGPWRSRARSTSSAWWPRACRWATTSICAPRRPTTC